MSRLIDNKFIKISILALFTTITTVSCNKDWLSEKADINQAIPETLKSLQAILDEYFSINIDPITISEIASDGHHISEALWPSATNKTVNSYTWSNNFPYVSSLIDWDLSYTRILKCNIVLDALEQQATKRNESAVEFDNIMGQAYFHRADAFFRLSQTWSPPYVDESTDSEMGIPLRLESDLSIPSIRSSINEMYARIINDFLKSANLLPEKTSIKTRPSKQAAFSMIARVYQSMRMYEKSGEYANMALQIDSSLLDFNTLPTTANFIGDYRTNPEVIFHITLAQSGINSVLTTNCRIDEDLYNSFDDEDLRKRVFFRKNLSTGVITFKGNYNNSASSIFRGPAVDELLLIRAESNARAGQIEMAIRDVNYLLRSRWLKIDDISTYVDKIATSKDQVMSIILEEREKELVLRGTRWTDLRRLNYEENYKTTINRTIGGTSYVLEPGSFHYTFPIPDYIIQFTGFKQNAGWTK